MLTEVEGVAEDIQHILTLRLLIARAGNKDSLAWWDDDSLSSHGRFLLRRIFPVAPQTAARSLALHAALSRHQAAYAAEPNALHLFRLDSDSQDELALRHIVSDSLPVPEEPIDTIEALEANLIQLVGEPRAYKRVRQAANQAILIEIPAAPNGTSLWLHRAQTLAWAYLEGAKGQPVFPYILE
jgi:hypothetical protein